ncbi:GH25 family lysozyme [Weissella sagaensis]|uniref:GH25 family lysozyme n=1 Tax=Weissella sagaensis TaxID=2559928 RepID=A0ABW1RTY6_9LACO|nr:GH25 family lysozyme [Weissella sagaensis]
MNNLKKIVMIAATSIVGMYALSTNDVTANSVPNITAGEANKPRMDLVDVSSWNKTLSVTDFQKMKAHGVRGVIIKLTEGNYYVSPVAATQISNARAAGLIVLAYHYAKYRSPQEAYQEADYFANQVQKLGLPTTTVLANDLEDSQTQAGNVTNNALAFRNRLTALGYQRQMLYTAPYYISQIQLDVNLFGNRNIWMASYPYNPTSDNLWHQQYGAWQWNSNTNFPGVTGVFDVSVDYGSQFLEEQATTTNVNDAIQNNEHETQPKPVLPTKPVEKKNRLIIKDTLMMVRHGVGMKKDAFSQDLGFIGVLIIGLKMVFVKSINGKVPGVIAIMLALMDELCRDYKLLIKSNITLVIMGRFIYKQIKK